MNLIGRWHSAQKNRTFATALVQLTCALVLIGMGGQQIVSAEAVYQFSNSSPINIVDAFIANPYPSVIAVSDVKGNITNITLTLHNLTHSKPSDIDIMLQGPTVGLSAIIMSDAGNAEPLSDVTITLNDNAVEDLPSVDALISGTSYRPQNYPGADDNFMSPPAPFPSANVSLSTFDGTNPNGGWNLWIVDSVDDAPPDGGIIAGGWTLTITTDALPWNFAVADWDGDTVPDLLGIFKDQTGSGLTEGHVLSGASHLQEFIDHVATPLPEVPEPNWEFAVADWDGDGIPDLVGIFKAQTESTLTEVHVLSGASHLQEFIDHVATPLLEIPGPNWEFAVADWDGDGIPDLVGIFKDQTESGQTEVHVLSGASHLQEFIDHVAIPLPEIPGPNWEFAVADWDGDGIPDLVGIFKDQTESGQTEVHVLSGASHLQEFIDHVVTPLPEVPGPNWEFAVADWNGDTVPDLVGIFKDQTESGLTEVHVLSGASHLQEFIDHVATALPQLGPI